MNLGPVAPLCCSFQRACRGRVGRGRSVGTCRSIPDLSDISLKHDVNCSSKRVETLAFQQLWFGAWRSRRRPGSFWEALGKCSSNGFGVCVSVSLICVALTSVWTVFGLTLGVCNQLEHGSVKACGTKRRTHAPKAARRRPAKQLVAELDSSAETPRPVLCAGAVQRLGAPHQA